jgi:two-component system, NarL family, invasion response regulator UvrY
MVVEDFVLIQENVRLVLERVCHCSVVATAEDSEAALSAMATYGPDIVTLDVSLPGMNGFELARMLNETYPATNLIFISAYSDRTYIESAFDLGAKAYLLKGAIAAELPAAIREVTAGRRYLSPVLRLKVAISID